MDHQSINYFITQSKIFEKKLHWVYLLSQFHFYTALIFGKHNQIVDALSCRPRVNVVSIAYHNDLTTVVDEYAIDPNFTNVMFAITRGKNQDPY